MHVCSSMICVSLNVLPTTCKNRSTIPTIGHVRVWRVIFMRSSHPILFIECSICNQKFLHFANMRGNRFDHSAKGIKFATFFLKAGMLLLRLWPQAQHGQLPINSEKWMQFFTGSICLITNYSEFAVGLSFWKRTKWAALFGGQLFPFMQQRAPSTIEYFFKTYTCSPFQ